MLTLEYDFTTLNDGDPLPDGLGFGILKDLSGINSVLDEAIPTSYFYAQKAVGDTIAKALFNYTTIDLGGGEIDHHGLLCSPGSLPGFNADVAVQFESPMLNFITGIDEFVFELGIGLRGKDKVNSWVGGLLSSKWTSGGGWSPLLELATVVVDENGITKLDTKLLNTVYIELNELKVRVKNTTVQVSYNGHSSLMSDITHIGEGMTVLWIKAYTKTGATVTPFAVVTLFNAESLQSGRFQPIKEIAGNAFTPVVIGTHFYKIPIQQLEAEKKLKQIAPQMWKFIEKTEVAFDGDYEMTADVGTVIISYHHLLRHSSYHWCKVKYDV